MTKHKTRRSLPDAAVKRYDHASLAEAMRATPGEWVKIDKDLATRMHALASKWKKARPRAYGNGVFEFRAITRDYGSGKALLFGRFVGDDAA